MCVITQTTQTEARAENSEWRLTLRDEGLSSGETLKQTLADVDPMDPVALRFRLLILEANLNSGGQAQAMR
ncbi:hypothetical protein LEP1GSC085_0013 [Leptospira interrogans str. L0996]|nr:hypothetical protein LEP1GSC085_0013 [Leptospira interrogans str. L0996]